MSPNVPSPSDLEQIAGQLRALQDELSERYHVRRIAIFGSRTRADATQSSDLDLLVTFGSEATLFDLVGMELDLGERLGLKVDIVTPSSLKPRLKARILGSAVPL